MNLKSLKNKFKNSKEAKNASWLIAGRIFQFLLSFIVGVITARFLGPSNYGLVNYGISFISFFIPLANLGLNSIMCKELIENPKAEGEVIGSALLLRFFTSILWIIFIAGIIRIIDKNDPLGVLVVVLCSFALFFNSFETINFWFQSKYKSKFSAIVFLVAYTATSIYKIVLLILGKDVLWFAFASSVDSIVIAICLLIFYKANHGPKLSYSFMRCIEMLKSSHHFIISALMVTIFTQTDKFMLKQMVSNEEVGFYSLAASISTIWAFLLTAIIDSFYPSIMILKKTNQEAYLRKNRMLYSIIIYLSLFVAVLMCIFGYFAIDLIYGEAYLPCVPVLCILAWHVGFSYLGEARAAWIVSEDKQKYLKYINAIGAFLNVGLNFCLIPHLGALGAAISTLIVEISISVLIPLFIKPLRPNVKLMFESFLLKDYWKRK